MAGTLDTKKLYIDSFNSTQIQKRENSKLIENIIFRVNFNNGPYFEVNGDSKFDFKVTFFDSLGNLVYTTTLKSNMWATLNKKYFEEWTIKVEYNNKSKIFRYDAESKKVFISINSNSLGDNIAWMPYLEEFRKKHKCNLVVSTFWNELFQKKYKNIKFINSTEIVNDIYAHYKIGYFYNSDLEPVLPNTIPLQKVATNILGLDYREIKPRIDFTPKNRPILEKYVAIGPHSTSGLKYWNNSTGWKEVVDFLISLGYRVINVSLEEFNLEGVENYKNNLINGEEDLSEPNELNTISNTMNLIYHSDFFIGLSSGLSWLSWTLDKHVFMISNFTEETHEFRTNCTRIVNKYVCNSCWNNPNFKFDRGDWNWCPIHKNTDRQFECHTAITGQMVIEKIKDRLSIL